MERKTDFITLAGAARLYSVSQLRIWQQPIKQKKNNESSTTKKSQFDYVKF